MPTPSTPLSNRDLELLSAYLDGELRPSEKDALETRLAREAELRSALDELQATRLLLRQAPRLKAPRSFALDPAISGQRLSWWQRLLLPGTLQISGALGAAVAVVLIAVGLLLNSREPSHPATDQPAALEIAQQPTQPMVLATPTSPASPMPAGTSTPSPTPPALYLATRTGEAEMAAPAPMLAQPVAPAPAAQPDIFPADTWLPEADAGEGLGAAAMAAPPGATELGEAPGETPPSAMRDESAAQSAAVSAAPPLEESAGEAAAAPSLTSPEMPKESAEPESSAQPQEKTPAGELLILAGLLTLAVAGTLVIAGLWKGHRV